ncbi:MAG: hypothetical protein Q8M76_14495 [Spirochaetaceae bacterium]|nr:hypothetical protein [Spirochaetaceae bacterium]
METLIQNLQYESTTVQALAVTAGGLIGVFATLGIFFLVIFVADKVGKKG